MASLPPHAATTRITHQLEQGGALTARDPHLNQRQFNHDPALPALGDHLVIRASPNALFYGQVSALTGTTVTLDQEPPRGLDPAHLGRSTDIRRKTWTLTGHSTVGEALRALAGFQDTPVADLHAGDIVACDGVVGVVGPVETDGNGVASTAVVFRAFFEPVTLRTETVTALTTSNPRHPRYHRKEPAPSCLPHS